MKVIGVNGSARKHGNTAIIMKTVFRELERKGIETELIQFGQNVIAPCRRCYQCTEHRNCIIQDDMFASTFQKLLKADGILLGSPVYAGDVSSNMKAFLDRVEVVVSTNPGMFRRKTGASVATVRRDGGVMAVDTMNRFFLNKEMIVVGSTYWNIAYGRDVGDVLNDEEGMLNMKNLGQNMAWTIEQTGSDKTAWNDKIFNTGYEPRDSRVSEYIRTHDLSVLGMGKG